MKRLIISAPFGNLVTHPQATSTVGTYTRHRRAGLWKRLWRVLRTVRYYHRAGAWVNQLGLPNPGIDSLDGKVLPTVILSIHGFTGLEWRELAQTAVHLQPLALELNLSCPNVTRLERDQSVQAVAEVVNVYPAIRVSAKLPPVRWLALARPLYDLGVRRFHLCNTIPTPGGGISGKPLKPYSLWATEEVKHTWGCEVDVTSGGGITCLQDVRDYISAGADRVAVGGMCFNPLNLLKLGEFARYLEASFKERSWLSPPSSPPSVSGRS